MSPRFKAGDRVRIVAGPGSGPKGRVASSVCNLHPAMICYFVRLDGDRSGLLHFIEEAELSPLDAFDLLVEIAPG
jgi:hypothetical protein